MHGALERGGRVARLLEPFDHVAAEHAHFADRRVRDDVRLADALDAPRAWPRWDPPHDGTSREVDDGDV